MTPMTFWMPGDHEPSEAWSSFGTVLEYHPALQDAIVSALPKPRDRTDAIDQVLAIYRWLTLGGSTSAQLQWGGRNDLAVLARTSTPNANDGVDRHMRTLAKSDETHAVPSHGWHIVSQEQAQRMVSTARAAGVARWMQLLHGAERLAGLRHAEMLVVKIYPTPHTADVPSMVLLALDEYLEDAVERRKQQPFTTFHLPTPQVLAQIRARRLDEATLSLAPGAPLHRGLRL